MKETFATGEEFDEDKLKMLIDKEATHQNIMDSFYSLVKGFSLDFSLKKNYTTATLW